MKLDLASGPYPHEGHEAVDKVHYQQWEDDFASHWVEDLSIFNWCWDDNEVEGIYCSHYVEHVRDLVTFMNEVGRILEPGGIAEFVHPYQHSNRAWQDPTHVRALNEDSWLYYSKAYRVANQLDDYLGITCDLELETVEFVLAPEYMQLAQSEAGKIRELARHSVNVVDDLHVTLRKV